MDDFARGTRRWLFTAFEEWRARKRAKLQEKLARANGAAVSDEEDSVELAGRLKALLPNARYLAMYLRNVADPMNEAYPAGFDGFIVKPF